MNAVQQARYDRWLANKEIKLKRTQEFLNNPANTRITGTQVKVLDLHVSSIYQSGFKLNPLTDTFERK